jgi:hypothetical protein
MARGQVDGWYPYDFIDPGEVGWGGVALYTLGITAGFLALGLLIVWFSHRSRRGAGGRPGFRTRGPLGGRPAAPHT